MGAASKYTDRINISKNAKEIVSKIDEKKYFGLQDTAVSRSELFLLAMAIGVDTVPTKLENIYPGGLILDKSIDGCTRALMYALFISRLNGAELDEITKKNDVYVLAQEYANTGFEVLEDYMNKKKDVELVWELLDELDMQYDKQVKGEQPEP